MESVPDPCLIDYISHSLGNKRILSNKMISYPYYWLNALGCCTKVFDRERPTFDLETGEHKQTDGQMTDLKWFTCQSAVMWYLLIMVKFRRCTLRKFWQYNKASLWELVLLQILGKRQQGLIRRIWPRFALPGEDFSWSEKGSDKMVKVAKYSLLHHWNFIYESVSNEYFIQCNFHNKILFCSNITICIMNG